MTGPAFPGPLPTLRFGAASAAHRIDGIPDAYGRGPSARDTADHHPGRTLGAVTTTDPYQQCHREDIAPPIAPGVDSHRSYRDLITAHQAPTKDAR